MNFDFAIHSAFLIHWTGKDIDCLYNPHWYMNEEGKSLTNGDCTQAYIKRLYSILKYGLWMTEEQKGDLYQKAIPTIPQVCFTELKLSESRKHARQYGRLGIGVKRPFVLNRLGRPLVYYHEKRMKNDKDKFLKTCVEEIKNADLLNFFKPMNSSDRLIYDFYSESEWRIIFFDELLKNKLIIKPNNPNKKEENNYYLSLTTEEQNKLKFLVPLDCWFSMIIYPSLEVKIKANQDDDIRELIAKIKKRNRHCREDESENCPIEIDLDDCRNF